MLVSDFHYDLPPELIAQHPPAMRGASRMLTLSRSTGAFADHLFTELPQLLSPGDLLVLNNSRVLPARLYATRTGLHKQYNSPQPSGLIEVLLTEHLASPEGQNDWRALVRPAKKIQPGETLHFAATPGGPPLLEATVISTGDFGERTLRFAPTPDFISIVERIGHMPLPPYIHRDKQQSDTTDDRERYQTIYSTPFEQQRNDPAASIRPYQNLPPLLPPSERNLRAAAQRELAGSAAAPTAGLHFTPQVLTTLRSRGVEIAHITLHVGLGTFQPVRVEHTEDIRLHAESYSFPPSTAAALNRATKENRRIIAVGTTTTRTLEHIARQKSPEAPFWPHSGSTSLFLSPGLNDEFRVVRGLLTNFHLPESTLLMLVSAFAGREAVLRAYAHAVAARYRFFSYGDSMLIT